MAELDLNSLKGLRIGYVPYSQDFSAPGDRRRFCFYARERGLSFEIPKAGKEYDLIILSSLADLTKWSRLPQAAHTRLVFDLVDSYLDIDRREWRARLRGPGKYLLGQHAHLEWSYHESIIRMSRRADVVVCSTPEQKQKLECYSNNVHDVLDFHTGETKSVKQDYDAGSPFNLVWEGVPGNVDAFSTVATALERVNQRHPIALHVLTDLEYKVVNGPIPKRSTAHLLRRRLPSTRAYLYEWNDLMFSQICTSCDLAIIPLLWDSPISKAKPENKLLLFWRMGLPTLTAHTAAYARTMESVGLDMTCNSEIEWERKLLKCIEDRDLRREAGEKGLRYANTAHGVEPLMKKWDAILAAAQG